MEIILNGFILSVAVYTAATDLINRTIKNKFIVPCILIALVIQIIQLNFVNIVIAIIAYLIMLFMLTDFPTLFGGGDLYLIVFLCLMFGPLMDVVLLNASISTAVLVAIYWIKEKLTAEKQTIPLAVSFMIATILTFF